MRDDSVYSKSKDVAWSTLRFIGVVLGICTVIFLKFEAIWWD